MQSDVKVLVVDDNPMVLAMLRDAIAPLARVSTAGDGADALLKAVEDTPDLLVSDFRMPGMDGRQLVEKLRSRSTTSGISVILLATKSDISEKLSVQDHTADDFVEKPFFLREATQRIKRMIDRISLEKMSKSSSGDGIVRGSLAQMNVIDLVQSLEMGRKSCLLTLTKDGDKCEMYFQEGQVPHATYGSLSGDAAVFKVLKWTGGNFQINFDGIVRGSLAQMNVIDLVQSLEMGRKSCLLTLTKDGDKCEMYFSEGQVPHATYGSLSGDAAVFKVLKWTGGNFQINFDGKTKQQTTTLNTQGLLMEGLRLLDEEKRDQGGQTEEEDDVLLDS